jgi:Flp pilus assembly protein TadG
MLAMLMRQQKSSRRWRCSGASILEMSLVLPILIMLSFGVVDYGYFFYLKNTFQGAALAGARAAIPYTATNANVSAIVTQMMTAAGFPANKYTLATSPSSVSGLSAGTPITVTVSATWSNIGTSALSTTLGGINGSKQIVGTAAMQKESN